MKMFVYNSSLVSFEVCIHIQYFSMQWEINFIQSISTRVNYIKRRSKVPEKNTSCGRALNFEQWKTFSENCKRMRVWLWFVYKFTENIVACNFSPSSFKLKRGILPLLTKYYPNLKTSCHIKPKFFLWTKLLENLLLAKYLISVTAALKSTW